MEALYLNEEKAEKLLEATRGPARSLLNVIKSVLIAGRMFSHLTFSWPTEPVDLFVLYSLAVCSLQQYQSGEFIDDSTRAAAVKRLVQLNGAQKILSGSNSIRCWDFLIIFDVLLSKHLSLKEEQINIPWVYEVLSRAISDDIRLDHILSRSSDFEDTPLDELTWE